MALTVQQAPPRPNQQRRRRKSRWADTFAECRHHPGQWRRVLTPLKKSTVAQIASDIRRAPERAESRRLPGIEPGERWDAEWGQHGEDFFVWTRFLGTTEDS